MGRGYAMKFNFNSTKAPFPNLKKLTMTTGDLKNIHRYSLESVEQLDLDPNENRMEDEEFVIPPIQPIFPNLKSLAMDANHDVEVAFNVTTLERLELNFDFSDGDDGFWWHEDQGNFSPNYKHLNGGVLNHWLPFRNLPREPIQISLFLANFYFTLNLMCKRCIFGFRSGRIESPSLQK